MPEQNEKRPVSVETYFGLDATSKADAITQIGHFLAEQGSVKEGDAFVKDVFAREDEMPTYIGHSIGLPHSKSTQVENAVVVVGRLNKPIIWSDDNQVDLIFLIAVPKESAGDLHLKILAQLARSLMHEDFREGLRTLSAEEVKELMYETSLNSLKK